MIRITINSNKELVNRIDNLLNSNYKLYGKKYCPCAIIKDDDTVCMCREFIEKETSGPCTCGKYIKEIISD